MGSTTADVEEGAEEEKGKEEGDRARSGVYGHTPCTTLSYSRSSR